MNRTRTSILTAAAFGSVFVGGSTGLLLTGNAAHAADASGTAATATAAASTDSGSSTAASTANDASNT